MKNSDISLAKILLNYHRVGHELVPADCIFVLGSNDPRVAERGAEVFRRGLASLIVFSGAVGPLTAGLYSATEAEVFAEIAIQKGVPKDKILLEKRSTNTGENAKFIRELLEIEEIFPRCAIVVQKPYMERRTLATFEAFWPELNVIVTSPELDFENLTLPHMNQHRLIEIIVGDIQRIIEYPNRGFQSLQPVPTEVLEAFSELVRRGYVGHLIK